MKRFTTTRNKYFRNQNAEYEKPTQVGYFSIDGNMQFHDDDSQLREFVPLNDMNNFEPVDLNEGFENFIAYDGERGGLDALLKWLESHKDLFELDKGLEPNFIMWRGRLQKLLCTLYMRQDWKMALTKVNGIIYVNEMNTDKWLDRISSYTESQQKAMYTGYKLEDLLSKPTNGSKNADVVNAQESFYTVSYTHLGQNAILLSGEVDCITLNEGNLSPPENYMEIKSSLEVRNNSDKNHFEKHNLHRAWAQSVLVGVPRILYGFKSKTGLCKSFQEFKTDEIPSLCKNHWNSKVCFNFLKSLLNWLRFKIVLIDDPNVVYIMTYDDPWEYIEVKQIDDGSARFLPDSFVKSFSG